MNTISLANMQLIYMKYHSYFTALNKSKIEIITQNHIVSRVLQVFRNVFDCRSLEFGIRRHLSIFGRVVFVDYSHVSVAFGKDSNFRQLRHYRLDVFEFVT